VQWFLLVAGRHAPARQLLSRPHRFIAVPRTPNRLRRRLGLDAPTAQSLSKRLTPPAQVFLARIQAFAVTPFRAHADVHVRIRLVRV
jgi:hypothetical protein